MRTVNVVDALREAIVQEMSADPSIFLIGEDVRIGGGFAVDRGLVELFGPRRVINTPISEIGFTGLAIGAAMTGMRAIVEYQFGDFVFCAMDQIVNQAAKLRYMSGGQVSVPVTFRLPVGANRRGAQHAQCSESIFMNVAGLYIVTPCTAYDAKGLLIQAIRSASPVLFFEHKQLYTTGREKNLLPAALCIEVPQQPYEIPFGKAVIRRKGADLTVIATMLMVHRALLAAEAVADEIDIEVIDPRTLVPLDIETIAASVRRTRTLVVIEECQAAGSWGNEAIAGVVERVSGAVAVHRLAAEPTPVPYATALENRVIPGVQRIVALLREIQRSRR